MNLMTSYALTVLIERMNKMGYKVTRDLITSLDIWKEYHRGYATEVSIALQILRGLGKVNSVFTIQDVKVLTERIAGTDYDRTHVMMESTLGGEKRLSSGVGTDIVEAFWEAVQDAVSDKIKNARNIKINSIRGRAMSRQRVQRDSGCHQWRASLERIGGGADRTALPVQHGLRCNRLSSADDGILSGKEIGLDTDRRGSLAFPSVFFCDGRKRWRNLRHSSNISDTVPFARGRRPWWMLAFGTGCLWRHAHRRRQIGLLSAAGSAASRGDAGDLTADLPDEGSGYGAGTGRTPGGIPQLLPDHRRTAGSAPGAEGRSL